MAYENAQVYAKYLKNKITSGCSDCSECSDCNESSDCTESCSCCPPGLVAIYNADGKHEGCLTPADADLHNESAPCAAGFVKLYKNAGPAQFLGCVGQDEFAALYAAVNPSV